MKEWLKVIPEADQATYRRAGFSSNGQLGIRPALLVIDVTLGFTGSPGLTLEQAIAQYSPACGPVSWQTMPAIARLIGTFRKLGRPVIYTRSELASIGFTGKATKATRSGPPAPGFNDFPEAIAPRADEWVLEKVKASAFFGTPLATCLVQQKIDSVVVCGVSTSGCVRASVVDCFSHGFPTFVVEDACFDRSWFAHCANLFDMSAKYATVLSLAELSELLGVQAQPDASQAGRKKAAVS
jgi:nicotinamidase-related amidase